MRTLFASTTISHASCACVCACGRERESVCVCVVVDEASRAVRAQIEHTVRVFWWPGSGRRCGSSHLTKTRVPVTTRPPPATQQHNTRRYKTRQNNNTARQDNTRRGEEGQQ